VSQHFISHALALAQTAQQNGEVPIGAVVVYDGKIIGEGWNQPIQSHDPTAHAEIIAIRDAAKHLKNYRLTSATLYVTLEPCLMCVGAMQHARIETIIFGAYDPKVGYFSSEKTIKQSYSPHWQGGVLEAECAALLVDFFKAKR